MASTIESQAFQAVLEIAAAIAGVLDPKRVAQIAVDRAAALLNADAAHLWIWDPDMKMLRCLARSDACMLNGPHEIDKVGTSLVGRVFRTRQALTVDDYPRWEHALPEISAQGVRCVVGMPLLVNDAAVGNIVVQNYKKRTFAGYDVQVLSVFAAQVAPALEAARLHTQSEQRLLEAEAAREEVRALNADLERRVSERTAELEAANSELEAFSYSVSHDLRAPLRSMDGFCQLLIEDYGERLDDEGRGHLQRVRRASQRMAQLIDDLLKLSRVTRTEMRRELVDLSKIAVNIVEDLQAGESHRRVRFSIARDLTAYGDARLLRVVLQNLLGNAWKFTAKHADAHIQFGRTQVEGAPAFIVKDDGAGFDMAYMDKLFGPFQRLHGMTEFDGTGIGLATVQRIINRHGGNVWAEGEVERGACFYFTL